MGSAPREALGFAGSLGSLARYAGMAVGITVASNILYGQMSVAMGEAVTSYIDNALPSYSLDSKALAELTKRPIPASLTTNPPTATRTTTATTPMTIRMRQCGVIKRTIRWTVCR